jgi:hypothetical protein
MKNMYSIWIYLIILASTTASEAFAQQFVGAGKFYKIQQVSNEQFLDAYTTQKDHAVVTRESQSDDTQKWLIYGPVDASSLYHDCPNAFKIMQWKSQRYLDAYTTQKDFGAVTRPSQFGTGSYQSATQHWTIEPEGQGTYSIKQCVWTGENDGYLDAYTSDSKDYRVVTRPAQQNTTQRWRITLAE